MSEEHIADERVLQEEKELAELAGTLLSRAQSYGVATSLRWAISTLEAAGHAGAADFLDKTLREEGRALK